MYFDNEECISLHFQIVQTLGLRPRHLLVFLETVQRNMAVRLRRGYLTYSCLTSYYCIPSSIFVYFDNEECISLHLQIVQTLGLRPRHLLNLFKIHCNFLRYTATRRSRGYLRYYCLTSCYCLPSSIFVHFVKKSAFHCIYNFISKSILSRRSAFGLATF